MITWIQSFPKVIHNNLNYFFFDNFVPKNSSLISFFAKLEKVINVFFLMLTTMKSWCLPNFSIHNSTRSHPTVLKFFENFMGEHAPRPPLFIMPSALVLGTMVTIPHLFPVTPHQGKTPGPTPEPCIYICMKSFMLKASKHNLLWVFCQQKVKYHLSKNLIQYSNFFNF